MDCDGFLEKLINIIFLANMHRAITQTLRDLAHSYSSICNVIRTIIETGEIGIIAYTLGNLLRFMIRIYMFVNTRYSANEHQGM